MVLWERHLHCDHPGEKFLKGQEGLAFRVHDVPHQRFVGLRQIAGVQAVDGGSELVAAVTDGEASIGRHRRGVGAAKGTVVKNVKLDKLARERQRSSSSKA